MIAAGLTDNFSYLPEAKLRTMAREAADQRPDVLIFCRTNMKEAELCADLEFGIGPAPARLSLNRRL